MKVSHRIICRMLADTAETLRGGVVAMERSRSASAMSIEAEMLWFGKTRQDESDRCRRVATRLDRQAEQLAQRPD